MAGIRSTTSNNEGIPMLRITRTFASSAAILAIAAAMTPVTANAWPLGKVFHLHPDQQKTEDARITVELINKGTFSQNVKVDGRIYSVLPHEGITIKAPSGTSVYAASAGLGHRSGDLLVAVAPETKGRIIYFN
jgi:hypothetical protein